MGSIKAKEDGGHHDNGGKRFWKLSSLFLLFLADNV